MIELYKKGYTYPEIAKEIGCAYHTVLKYLPDQVPGRESYSLDAKTKVWFKKEWANIYPGDKAREVIKNGQT